MSIVTLFYDAAEITLTKVNVFGSEIKISNPSDITWAIWVVFLYFLLRYYQHFHDMPDRGIQTLCHQKTVDYHQRLAMRRGVKKFTKDNPGFISYEPKRKEYVWLNPQMKLIRVKSPIYMLKSDHQAIERPMEENVQLSFSEKFIGYVFAFLYVCLSTRTHNRVLFPVCACGITTISCSV
jgi:hypothetical protein